MESLIVRHRGALLFGAAVIITAWGTIGFFQGLGGGFSGGLYSPRYVVDGVMPGGAGEKAGLRVGDRVISVEGKPVEEVGMESRWPRSLTPLSIHHHPVRLDFQPDQGEYFGPGGFSSLHELHESSDGGLPDYHRREYPTGWVGFGRHCFGSNVAQVAGAPSGRVSGDLGICFEGRRRLTTV
jgi:hypothetical protein